MKILKFGGSSVATPELIQNVIGIVSDPQRYQPGEVRAVVVSAFQGVTDTLIALAHSAALDGQSHLAPLRELEQRHISAVQHMIPVTSRSGALAAVKVLINELEDVLQGVALVGECSARVMDFVMAFGERLSAYIVSQAWIAAGHDVEMLDTREVIITTEVFGNARPIRPHTDRAIQEYFAAHPKLQIATGFIGSTPNEATVTLGRGGSDFTASILGAALGVDEIEIWTDVDGMLTADPRRVPKAFPMPEVTFEEAMELCHFGAKVIYPPTIQPAIEAHIPLVIKNTKNPQALGTRIVETATRHPYPITGISSISSIALARIQGTGMVGVAGIAMRFFRALAKHNINVILITQASSEHTICCAIDPSAVEAARRAVDEEFELEIKTGLIEPLFAEEDLAIISVVGERMRHTPGMSGRVFTALGANSVNVVAIAQGSSELNISAVIPNKDEAKALNALHDEFFLSQSKTVNLWIVGAGLIGSTLMKQLHAQRETLRETLGIDLQLRGLANSRTMLLTDADSAPIEFSDHALNLGRPFVLDQFASHLISANLSNCIFVDCTASDDVPRIYPRLLERSIAVVTPNKRGISADMQLYSTLKNAAQKRRTPFLHETCVGAALPVLNTLADLVRSGDKVVKIEAVLSGTLSFIFNSMAEGVSFSAAVLEAKTRGYTEPDPRDDLSGMDVARKALILAREAGIPLELEQITRHPLLPEEALTWSLEDFLTKLPSLDRHFESLVQDARKREGRLACGALIDCANGKVEVGLRTVSLEHPFASLKGSDNLVAFTTRRYASQPLVVKGPGAGAEVTAAGVFADIIRIAR